MGRNVLCLRPEADFTRVGVTPPAALAITYKGPEDPDLAALIAAADALLIPAVGPKLPADLFADTHVQLVQVTGAGVDRVDPKALRARSIRVANVPGGSNAALAEYVAAAAATLQRRMTLMSAAIKNGSYAACRTAAIANNIQGLDGLTAGVIGLGAIGHAVAERLAAAGCHIVYYDPAPRAPARAAELGWKSAPLVELLTMADIVTVHVPLLPETTGLIGRAELAAMKQGSILINAARGGIVDERALADALVADHLAGAAVDVYTTEPPALDNPLLTLPPPAADRLLLTPHIAGVTRQSWATLFREAWTNVERVLVSGDAPLYVVE